VSSIRYLLIILLSTMLLLSCSDNGDVPKARMANIIRDIEHSFNDTVSGGNDVSSIMKYYHEDYRHNGGDRNHINGVWRTRARDYENNMKTHIISIDTDNNVVHLTITFYPRGSETPIIYTDPGTFGDMSFFYEDDDGKWWIYGNQDSHVPEP